MFTLPRQVIGEVIPAHQVWRIFVAEILPDIRAAEKLLRVLVYTGLEFQLADFAIVVPTDFIADP